MLCQGRQNVLGYGDCSSPLFGIYINPIIYTNQGGGADYIHSIGLSPPRYFGHFGAPVCLFKTNERFIHDFAFITASTLKRTQPLFITTQEKFHKDKSDRRKPGYLISQIKQRNITARSQFESSPGKRIFYLLTASRPALEISFLYA